MPIYSNQPSSTSSSRVRNWLDSLYYHHSSLDEDEKTQHERSSLASNNSNKSSSNSRKSLSSSSDSSSFNQNVRKINLRKPRYLIRRFRRSKASKLKDKSTTKSTDHQSSYSSNSSSGDESNRYSNRSTHNYLNDGDLNTQKLSAEIKADDLDFNSRTSLMSINSNCTTESLSNSLSNNLSSNNRSFGILDLVEQRWTNGLQLDDEVSFKVKTYAFEPKDIKIKLKENTLIVIGKQKCEEANGFFKREFKRVFDLPFNADKKNIKLDYGNDQLIITVPKIHSVH